RKNTKHRARPKPQMLHRGKASTYVPSGLKNTPNKPQSTECKLQQPRAGSFWLRYSPTLVFPKSGSVIPKLWSDGGGGKAPEIPHEEGLQTQPRELQGGKSSLSQEGVRRCSWSSELVEKPHGREKAHKCLECGKGFSRSSTLMEHQNIHIGERSCECGECGKSFSGSSDLTKDHKIHTGKRWNSEILMEHQNIHIGKRSYECGECGKSFSGSSDLSKHHKIHTGERLHECLECQKSFRWNSEIVTHQHVHTRKRPCECPECGKSFVRSINGLFSTTSEVNHMEFVDLKQPNRPANHEWWTNSLSGSEYINNFPLIFLLTEKGEVLYCTKWFL
uniref:C2H2-type domain-containing protein n=1 Tax=Serinus canaria TaxID=9135 RepID=A0A8C9MGV9_SERCA